MKKIILLLVVCTVFACQVPITPIMLGTKLVIDGNSLLQSRNGVKAVHDMILEQMPGIFILDDQGYVNPGHYDGIGMVEMWTDEHINRLKKAYQPGAILLVWELEHDLTTGGFTAEQTVERFWHYCDTMSSYGYTIITLDALPNNSTVTNQPDYENKRIATNEQMKIQWSGHINYFIDIANDFYLGDINAPLQGIYYDPIDKVHLTTIGAEIVTQYIVGVLHTIVDK